MKLYDYVRTGSMIGLMSMSTLQAMPVKRDRKLGDERKFEATHILWQKQDTKDTRNELIDTQFNNESVYLRSGSVIGLREFSDPSTLMFELATGSRLGHVAIAISAADMIEVMCRFIERGGGIKEGIDPRHTCDVDASVKDLDQAYAPYMDLAKKWNGGQWKREGKRGKIHSFHPFKDKSSSICSSAFCPLEELIGDLFYQPPEEGGYENAYEALLEARDNIEQGKGRFYKPHTKGRLGRGRAPLDVPILLHFAPGAGLHMQTNLSSVAYEYASLWECNSGLDKAIDRGDTSVIEPKEDLTPEQVQTIVFYCLYLKQAGASYNYTQSEAGMFCQNCSEFIHNLFGQIGVQVGFKQRMGTLNTKAVGGALKNYGWLLGMYAPSKIVVTPKSVMQTAVTYTGEGPHSVGENEELPILPMRVVKTFDRLAIATTVSDRTLWDEWEKAYQELRKYHEEAKYLKWGFFTIKNILGNPFVKLSKVPFESHSREKRINITPTNWSLMQRIGATVVGLGTIGGIYMAMITPQPTHRTEGEEHLNEEESDAQEEEGTVEDNTIEEE